MEGLLASLCAIVVTALLAIGAVVISAIYKFVTSIKIRTTDTDNHNASVDEDMEAGMLVSMSAAYGSVDVNQASLHAQVEAEDGPLASSCAHTMYNGQRAQVHAVTTDGSSAGGAIKWNEAVVRNSAEDAERETAVFHVRHKVSLPLKADVSVQCQPEDMLEPMARSVVFQSARMKKLRSAPLIPDAGSAYSPSTHFSSFEEPKTLAAWAAKLGTTGLQALAARFLGTAICGVPVCRSRGKRSVPERHVKEAEAIAKSVPAFRCMLLSGARSVLFHGSPASGLRHGLLSLAAEAPSDWSPALFTATDLIYRLVQCRVLPRAVLAEILREAVSSGQHAVFVTWLSSEWGAQGDKIALASPRMSEPAELASPILVENSALRSTNRAVKKAMHIGTSLRPQDESWRHCFVSVANDDNSTCPIAERLIIDPGHLPEYWRKCAGGEHSERELEKRALQAEADNARALQAKTQQI
eukprot:TRINITY_DN20904_c0_g2_i1.p1 TRINITY_DN20904_c0_g2~~TRINITY_DN20904_c0_g2_i1.p1  ORF type:complete len:492 (-),score=68.03 TRINITY_DN20904_c0_g2_i1:167-1573(-)